MRLVATIPVFALLLSLASPAQSAYTVNVNQVGADVVFVGTGSLNITGLVAVSDTIRTGVGPAAPGISLGVPDYIPASLAFVTFTGSSNFGTGPIIYGTIGSGDRAGFDGLLSAVFFPRGYVSGTTLNSTSTFANATIASLGLASGNYTFSYSARNSASVLDSFTIRVNPSAVPEPASLAMVGLGLAGLGLVARRRRV